MSPRPNDAARRVAWLLAVLLVLLLGGASVWAAGQAVGPAAAEKQPQPAKESTVKLTVVYGDGVEKRFKALEWKPGLTALEALELAGQHKRGVKVQHRGAEATALSRRSTIWRTRGAAAETGCIRSTAKRPSGGPAFPRSKPGTRSCGPSAPCGRTEIGSKPLAAHRSARYRLAS
jgi:hypothetical protein